MSPATRLLDSTNPSTLESSGMPGTYIPEDNISGEESHEDLDLGEVLSTERGGYESETLPHHLSDFWELTSLAEDISSCGISRFNFFQGAAIERSRELRQFKALNNFARKLSEDMQEEPDEVTRKVEDNIWDLF